VKKEIFIGERMSKYTKLFADLANMDELIKDEDKALILLSSLPDNDYKSFILILINSKQSLSYNELLVALVNHELRWKDKESSNNTSAEALTARIKGSNRKVKGDRERSKLGTSLNKNLCAFCKVGH